jgi:hypothetical protein
MNCAAVEWALSQTAPSSSAKLLLIAIASRIENGVLQASQAELGRIVQMTDRSVRTALKLLQDKGLITRTPNAGSGAGRLPDTIALGQPERQPETVEQAEGFAACKIAQPEKVSVATGKSVRSNRKSVPQQPEKSATKQPEILDAEFVDNPPRVSESTGAHAETLTLNITTSESYPERLELVSESDAPPSKRGTRMRRDWRPSRDTQAMAKQLGIVNGWGDATLANFIDYWLGVPGQKGIKLDWDATYRNELRKEVHARRHFPSTYENTNDQSSSAHRAQPRNSGGPLSTSSEILLRKIARGRADDERRVESHTGK